MGNFPQIPQGLCREGNHMIDEVFICQICKEPIHNFVCIDCLAKDIVSWLPEKLKEKFSMFNRMLLDCFNCPHDHQDDHRLVCSAGGKGSICLFCYVNEVFQWLKTQNKKIAWKFRKAFSFGSGPSEFRNITKANPHPITELSLENEEFGICDECGEYSDELRCVDGKWMCKECGALW